MLVFIVRCYPSTKKLGISITPLFKFTNVHWIFCLNWWSQIRKRLVQLWVVSWGEFDRGRPSWSVKPHVARMMTVTKIPYHQVLYIRLEAACEQVFWGALAAGQEKEGELATTSLEFEFRLQFPCGSPSTELLDFLQSARSGNQRECARM